MLFPDFLPFSCEGCSKVFCLEHRSQDAHKCTAARVVDQNIIPLCPVCGKHVKLASGESPDLKVSAHIESGCTLHVIDLSKKAKSACSYSKCKSVRAPIKCKACHKMYCAEHRFASDHKCASLATSAAEDSSSFGSALSMRHSHTLTHALFSTCVIYIYVYVCMCL